MLFPYFQNNCRCYTISSVNYISYRVFLFLFISDDESQKRRPFITLMSKFRATQTLGATLSTKGNHQRASNLYKKLINDALQLREHLTVQQQRNLEKAIAGVEGNTNDDIQSQAWKMRSAIDLVYDECISDFNEVSCAMPSNLQSVIKEVINSASTCIAEGDFTKGLTEYATILRQLKNNRKYKDNTSVVCQRIVDEALQAVDSDDTIQVKVSNLRQSLDLIYNEIRLPDVFSPSMGPLVCNFDIYFIIIYYTFFEYHLKTNGYF